jgi:hypothetical protein
MSKSGLASVALLAGIGAVVKTQLPEIRRYLEVRKM